MRRLLALALASLLLASCGGGGDKASTPTTTGGVPSTATAPPSSKPPSARAPEAPSTTSTSPESKPGGAGDETPAHFDATLTGRAGRIAPLAVHVGPYISVRVVLKSGDGQRYSLSVNGKTLEAGGSRREATLSLPGLRPGESYTLRQPGGGPAVRVTANAEPGP